MNRSLSRSRTITVALAATGLAVAGLIAGGPALAQGHDDAPETNDDHQSSSNDDGTHDNSDDDGTHNSSSDDGAHHSRDAGLDHVTVCVTAPGGGAAPARTRIIALSANDSATERSVRRINANGCATVAFLDAGQVRFRAVGVSSADGTTKVYRAVWPVRSAASIDDSDVLRKQLVRVR